MSSFSISSLRPVMADDPTAPTSGNQGLQGETEVQVTRGSSLNVIQPASQSFHNTTPVWSNAPPSPCGATYRLRFGARHRQLLPTHSCCFPLSLHSFYPRWNTDRGMEGTTHQHVHAWQMALGRHAPFLRQGEALEPVFSLVASGRTSIACLQRVEWSRTHRTSLTETAETASLGKGGTTKNAYYGFYTLRSLLVLLFSQDS